MSFGSNRDEYGLPIMPPGKLSRVLECSQAWYQFWFDRKALLGGAGGAWLPSGAFHADADGKKIAEKYKDKDTGEYDFYWEDRVIHGTNAQPVTIEGWSNWYFLATENWWHDIIRDDPETANSQDPVIKWIYNFNVWTMYQILIANCIYHLAVYVPRPGAGRHESNVST